MLNVSVSEAREKFVEILDRVSRGKERIAVGDEGAPLAVLVPIEDLGLLEGHGGPALPDGEQRFRDFAETASDWFWETDMEQRFTYYSGSGPLDSVFDLKNPSSIIGKTRHEVWRGSDDPNPIDTSLTTWPVARLLAAWSFRIAIRSVGWSTSLCPASRSPMMKAM